MFCRHVPPGQAAGGGTALGVNDRLGAPPPLGPVAADPRAPDGAADPLPLPDVVPVQPAEHAATSATPTAIVLGRTAHLPTLLADATETDLPAGAADAVR
jgi:hypothetical protein